MADNTVLPVGAGGDTIADEDIAGVKYQKVKLIDPTAGSTTPIGTVANPINVANASLPLPTGASTAVRQDTGNTSVASIDTKTPALGQQVAAASSPVVLTAAQVTTLTPPAAISGFALEAGHLATIDTSTAKIPSQGQALAASSMPVVLTAIQQAALTPPAAITGFALESGHLATLDANTPTLGQKAMAGSSPVVIASDQVVPVTVNSLPVGQQLMLVSTPIVIASDQDSIQERISRRDQQLRTLEQYDTAMITALVRRGTERFTLTDRRGSTGRGSSR